MIVKGGGENANTLREDPASFDAAELIRELEKDMVEASSRLEYERAALLRDQIAELKSGTADGTAPAPMKKSPIPNHPEKNGDENGRSKIPKIRLACENGITRLVVHIQLGW